MKNSLPKEVLNLELIDAAATGDLASVKYFLSKGADIHADGDCALRKAAEKGHFDIVKYLISKGANIHAKKDYALRVAAKKGHLEIVKYLFSKGANIHACKDYALRWAVWYSRFKTAEWLLDHGANPNAKDSDGPILQLLMEEDQLRLAAKAVSYGADPTVLSFPRQQRLNNYILSKKITTANIVSRKMAKIRKL